MPNLAPMILTGHDRAELIDRPIVTFGGVPMEIGAGPVVWALEPGVSPVTRAFKISNDRVNQLWPQEGPPAPRSLRFRVQTIRNGHTETFDQEFRGIYLLDKPLRVDQFDSVARITDLRWKWSYAKVTGRFNHIKRINDLEIVKGGDAINIAGQAPRGAQFGQIEDKFGDAAVGNVIAQRLAQPVSRYRNWSLNNGKPWTAFEIAMAILLGRDVVHIRESRQNGGQLIRSRVPGILADGEWGGIIGDDSLFSDFIPDAITWRFESAPSALAEMLRLARAQCCVMEDGKLWVYPLDDDEPRGRLPGSLTQLSQSGELFISGSGWLDRTQNFMTRPAVVKTAFEIEEEVTFKAVSDVVSSPDFLMSNVMRLPFAKTIDGIEYAAGEYIPIETVLTAYKSNTELVRRAWHEHIFFEDLKTANGLKPDEPSAELDHLIQELLDSYRQVFQIDPRQVDVLLSLQPNECTQISQTGIRTPSRVWTVYAVIPPIRLGQKVDDEYDPESVAGWNVFAIDTDQPSAPFMVEVIDAELGIIRFHPVSDAQNGFVLHNLPGGFDDLVQMPPHMTPDGAEWGNVPLREKFTIETRLTARWADPNSEDGYYMVSRKPASAEAARGPELVVFVDRETARFDVDGNLVNGQILDAIADAEAKRIYLSFRDRWIGEMTFGGGFNVRPFGAINRVEWVFTSDGEFHTVIEAREPSPIPRTEEVIRRELLGAYLRRPKIS